MCNLFSEIVLGIGVIIRNEVGHVMAFLSQQISLPFTAIKVEALTARLALEIAR